ncbi:hypothetical protein C8R44DRAFT_151027 [Mycena epipterygia]|nr:hypothetical protein C8R44DRAFT_151027 [Mycena epipterygia]
MYQLLLILVLMSIAALRIFHSGRRTRIYRSRRELRSNACPAGLDITRRMAYILFPMLLAELVSMLVILLIPATYHSVHYPVMRGPYFAFYALPPLLVTFAMFILTVYKCSKTLYLDKSIGIVWFVVVFGIDGVQMFVWATGRATLTQVLYSAIYRVRAPFKFTCPLLTRINQLLRNDAGFIHWYPQEFS